MTLLYNMYKLINFHSGLFSELRYMSNGQKPTFILDHPPPLDRL